MEKERELQLERELHYYLKDKIVFQRVSKGESSYEIKRGMYARLYFLGELDITEAGGGNMGISIHGENLIAAMERPYTSSHTLAGHLLSSTIDLRHLPLDFQNIEGKTLLLYTFSSQSEPGRLWAQNGVKQFEVAAGIP